MSSLREDLLEQCKWLTGQDKPDKLYIDNILATLQTAVLAAAPEKIDESNNTVRSYQYKRIGFNDAITQYTKALQQLFESEQL